MPEHEAPGTSDGLGRLASDAAELADRTFDRMAKELRNARALGQFAVGMGAQEVRRRVRSTPTTPSDETSSPPPSTPSPGTADDAPHGAIDDLISGYDDLSASQVVGLLDDLDHEGLERVADHERRGRGRRTILGRTAQLLEQSP